MSDKNKEIYQIDTVDHRLDCTGYQESNCCGAFIDSDIDLCHDCKEHADTRCTDCDESEGCPNKKYFS